MRPDQCATPGPGEPLDDKLERMQADGQITVHDADEVRNFASFLRAAATDPAGAWREHYPDDYARAVAERDARARRADEPAREPD